MFEFTWNVDPVLIELGPIAIRYYGLLFLLVFLGGYSLFRWQVERGGGTQQEAVDIFVPAILGVLIGSRLGHILFYEPAMFIERPLEVLKVWHGGLASHGATIGLLIAIWYYAKRHGQSYVESLDRFAFSAALGATLVRVGNFVNSEIVGRVTDQTWGVRFPRHDASGPCRRFLELCTDFGVPFPGNEIPLRHPSQLYEVFLGLGVMGILWIVDRVAGKEKRPRGLLISTFFVAYFLLRFTVEFWKEQQGLLKPGDPITMGQILSIPAVLGGIVWMVASLRKNTTAHWNVVAPTAAAPARAERRRHGKRR